MAATNNHSEGEAAARETSQMFVDESYLTYMVPLATDFRLEETLRDDGQGAPRSYKARFDAVEQRDWLFFDETVDVYLILRMPLVDDEATLRSQHLPRMAVTVEAQIVNSHAPDRDSPSAVETVYTGAVGDVDYVGIFVDDEEQVLKDGERRHMYAVWKRSVLLGRPRIRLQAPSVVLLASATMKPARRSVATGKDYLESRVPPRLNLLESFANDAALGGVKPRLSALRVSRVVPVTNTAQARPIRGLQRIKMKIYPAVHARVRFARPNTMPPSPVLLALLEIDFTPFFDCEVLLTSISLVVDDGTVEDLTSTSQESMCLPLSCVAHDHVTYLYRLSPERLEAGTKPGPTKTRRDLGIGIEIVALVRDNCRPRLSMAWTTALDFTLPLNPDFGQPMAQPMQRAHKPNQLSIGGATDQTSFIASPIGLPDVLPALEAAAACNLTETAIPDFGITMTFTGPEQPVYAGHEFVWTVLVVNRTTTTDPAVVSPPGAFSASSPPRKLALIALPRRRPNDLRVLSARQHVRTRGKSIASAGAAESPFDVADAVADKTVVYAMQRASVIDATDVIPLSPDVRVGPLAPGACAVVELKLLALRPGFVGIEAVRVVDLGSAEHVHVDVREVPAVLVLEAGLEETSTRGKG